MPRSKHKNNVSPSWTEKPHELSENVKEDLLYWLNFDGSSRKKSQIIKLVEKALSGYEGASARLDNPARPSEYKKVLKSFAKRVSDCEVSLNSMHYEIKYSLELSGLQFEDSLTALENIQVAIKKVIEQKTRKESRGKARKVVLLTIIGKLREIFQANYNSQAESDQQNDSDKNIKKLTEKEYDEIQFICVCLDDANIKYPKDIRRLFLAPKAALQSERPQVIDRIAKKIEQKRRE